MSPSPDTSEILRDDGLTCLIRVRDHAGSGRPSLLKRRSGPPSARKLAYLYADHDVVSRHSLRCALPFVRAEGTGHDTVLVFDDPGGAPLDQAPATTLPARLTIATAMVHALEQVHGAGLIHRDLCPDSFLVTSGPVYLTDFSQSARLRRDHRDFQFPHQEVTRLRYVSPELTGRVNRPADYRSDYYSLGVILYRLFVGRVPFDSNDPAELIYHHLARPPASPREHAPELPATLSCVLLRLLEKEPERRYGDSAELLDHLRICSEVAAGRLADNPNRVAPVDSLDQGPGTPQGIYGRSEERERLLERLERSLAHQPQLLLIAGSSGVGKTALIRETYLPVTRHNAFFVSGKFDQIRRGTPYSAWTEVFERLLEFLLAEPATRLSEWRDALHAALGVRSQALAGLMPSLGLLLREPEKDMSVPPSEARQRLHDALLRFLQVFAQRNRALVIFLDDLQWIDAASLDLLEVLVRRADGVPLLLLGAYRSNEVDRTHPFRVSMDQLRSEDTAASITPLALEPLRHDDVRAMLADATRRSAGEVQPLAAELMRKTLGNPFFIQQFLRTARENGWLWPAPSRGRWEWNIDRIRAAEYAEHVVDLMLHRFGLLPAAARQLLCWAACLGTRFELQLLARLTGLSPGEAAHALQPALDEEFILPLGTPEPRDGAAIITAYRFFHDRMQEAAYKAIPGDDIALVHGRIAELLRADPDRAESAAGAIEIAGHMNLALELVSTVEDALDLARVNLAAARAARGSAAFHGALQHLRLGMSRLPDDLWEQQPDLAYELFRERGELEYLNGEFGNAEHFLGEAIAREPDPFRKADVYQMLVVQYTLRASYGEAIEAARRGLRLFGLELPQGDYEAARDGELTSVDQLLQRRPLRMLSSLPEMTDPGQRAVMNLLTALGPPCYRSHPGLWSVIVALQMRLCLEHGTVPEATYTYPAFGGLLTHVGAGDGADYVALWQATRGLIDVRPDSADASVGYLMAGSSLRHWFAPLREASRDYLAAYQSGQASGNLQYAVYGFGHNTYCRYFQGVPLDELIPEALGYLDYSRQRRNSWGIDLITGALRIFTLLHGTPDTLDWPNRSDSESAYRARCAANGNVQVECIYHVMRASALLQVGDIEGAAESVREAESRLDSISVQGLLPASQFPALKCLVLSEDAALLGESRAGVDDYLTHALTLYDRWQRMAPENFGHWYHAIQALCAVRDADYRGQIEAWDSALEAAQMQGFWPATAVIARGAERTWRRNGHTAFANAYGEIAHHALVRYGADGASSGNDADGRVAGRQRGAQMDSVIRIAEALSLHTGLEQLVPEIIQRVAEHTGAQRIVLLLTQDDQLRIIMEGRTGESRYHSSPPALDTTDDLPRSVIRYVARSKRTLRFARRDIGSTLLLSNDPYLERLAAGEEASTATVWCVPLIHLGQGLGVLYLEHGFSRDALDSSQLPLIEFLAAQAAISVRNIELINSLAEEGRARQQAESRVRDADTEMAKHRATEQELRKLAQTDELTGLANRRMFMERLEDEWQARRRTGAKLPSILMLDLDHFKHINDHHGHAVGDEVLRHAAVLLRDSLRSGDLAARFGGEEFAILLPGADHDQALEVGQRICDRVRQTPARSADRFVPVTISIGVAQIHPDDSGFSEALDRADQALYEAKAAGRDTVRSLARA